VGKFFLGALIGSGLTGGLGAWLAGQVPAVASPTIESRDLARELNQAHSDLRAVKAERDRNALVVRVLLDALARSSHPEHGPGVVISFKE